MRQERAAAAKCGGSMGDSETAQQGSAGEHAGDVTDNGHAGDVADDEVVGAVPPGAFGPAATSSLQDSLLLMSTEHSNHGSTPSTSQRRDVHGAR